MAYICNKPAGSYKTCKDKHGEKNGWFQYPINFDPIWLNYCDGFKEKE